MLTTFVRINRAIERNIRRFVVADDGAGRVFANFCFEWRGLLVFKRVVAMIAVRFARPRVETHPGLAQRTAALNRFLLGFVHIGLTSNR